MLKISVQMYGDKAMAARLKQAGIESQDWTPELKQIGDYMIDFYQNKAFETEGGIFGARWPRISASYDFNKRKKYPGRGILQASGDLRRGFQSSVEPRTLTVGNVVDYAKFHQFGTSRLPKRAIIDVNPELKGKIEETLKTGIMKRLGKALK